MPYSKFDLFNVDPEQDLVGYVDFLIARSPRLLMLEFPVVMLVEAKPENLNARLGQCAAAMIAAQIFNQRANPSDLQSSESPEQSPRKLTPGSFDAPIYGCVTNGELWKFLKLHHSDLTIDLEPYPLDPLDRLLGILLHLACKG